MRMVLYIRGKRYKVILADETYNIYIPQEPN